MYVLRSGQIGGKSYFSFFQRKYDALVLFIYIIGNDSTVIHPYCEFFVCLFKAFVVGIMNNYKSYATVSHRTISTVLRLL